jgi:hypothetical protein
MFTLNKRGPNYYTVDITKFNTVGEIYREVDGYFVFAFTDITGGYFSEHFFRFVFNALESLNGKINV